LRFDHEGGLRALVLHLQLGDVVEVLAIEPEEAERAVDQEIDHHDDGEELQPEFGGQGRSVDHRSFTVMKKKAKL
jgi:hypothetical protein